MSLRVTDNKAIPKPEMNMGNTLLHIIFPKKETTIEWPS